MTDLLRALYDLVVDFRYEVDVYSSCRPSCASWDWVLYRVDQLPLGGEARTPVETGRFLMFREYAIECAVEAARRDNEKNWRGWAAAGVSQLPGRVETVRLETMSP